MDFVAIGIQPIVFAHHPATNYGKTIIMEMNLPHAEKTVMPVSIGGFAGGQCFQWPISSVRRKVLPTNP